MNNAQKLKKAISLLEGFSYHYQLDHGHPLYLGFITVGHDMSQDEAETWQYICDNKVLFMLVLSELGLATEEGLDFEETVLVKKK